MNDIPALKRIIKEVLEDFANDNVVYLELRTGPKVLLHDNSCHENGYCTKKEYVEVILDIMIEFERQDKARYENACNNGNGTHARMPMMPRLIISVDRSGTVEQAGENISLAIDMVETYPIHIVGVELGGNPTHNDFRLFQHLFQKARGHGLQVSIHCGEIQITERDSESSDIALKNAYEEALAVINFRPDRLGHALLIPDALMNRLIQQPIPIECCPKKQCYDS